MLFEIIHRTRYNYSVPVFLEPLTLRLRPRCDATQTLRSYRVDVTPTPGGISHCVGLDGNNTETVWFSGLHENLVIEVHTVVETHRIDPFDFLITDPAALDLPLKYGPHLEPVLAHYRVRERSDPMVAAFAQEIMQATKHETIPFLSLLAEQIRKRCKYMLREHGAPWTPEETLKQGRGACRDLAVLFIDVCRSAGIAARFVSGYCIGDEASTKHMHAWAEVYLPGAGWRGYDPSRGLATTDDHIAVAAGHSAQDATPTFGHYRGEAASSLVAEISIRVLENQTGTMQQAIQHTL
jgi:transglutaminase-like putative cysteine protease